MYFFPFQHIIPSFLIIIEIPLFFFLTMLSIFKPIADKLQHLIGV